MGGGAVKVLILQFFWDMEMVCTWSHKSRLSRILHFLQRCCLFPRMLDFCLAFWKRKHVYIQWFLCLQWILHCIVVHITICTYTYIIYTVARPVAISHKVSLKPKHCASATLIQKTLKIEPKHGPKNGTAWRSHFWDHMHSLVKEQKTSTFTVPFLGPSGCTKN